MQCSPNLLLACSKRHTCIMHTSKMPLRWASRELSRAVVLRCAVRSVTHQSSNIGPLWHRAADFATFGAIGIP